MFEIRCDTVSSEQSRADRNRGSTICPGGNAVVASRSLEAYILILRKALLISAISGPLQLRARGTKLGSARIAPGARQPRRHYFGGGRLYGCRAPILWAERRHCA